MKRLILALLAAATLGGCVVAPAYPDAAYYPAPGYYYGPSVGFYYGGGGGYYHHHRHWR